MQQNITTRAAVPAIRITDARFAYTSAASTDVTRTFKKHGWSEPDRGAQRSMKLALNQIDEAELALLVRPA